MSNAELQEVRELAKNRKVAGQLQRRAWDSNPQVLADNGFQDRPVASYRSPPPASVDVEATFQAIFTPHLSALGPGFRPWTRKERRGQGGVRESKPV
jgi:hypothetical protein